MIYIIISIATILLAIYATLLWHKLSSIQDNINIREQQRKSHAALSFQREKLENAAITANNTLVGTYVRFGDINHLLLANTHTDLVASKNTVDYSFSWD